MSYLRFEITEREGRKTDRWWVFPIAINSNPLGMVAWYSPWRRYAFGPVDGIAPVFDSNCLKEIAAFIDAEMAKRK